MTRKCTKCGKEKPMEAFHRTKTNKAGRLARCAECVNYYWKLWSIKNDERVGGEVPVPFKQGVAG